MHQQSSRGFFHQDWACLLRVLFVPTASVDVFHSYEFPYIPVSVYDVSSVSSTPFSSEMCAGRLPRTAPSSGLVVSVVPLGHVALWSGRPRSGDDQRVELSELCVD